MAKQRKKCTHSKENISQFIVSPLETGIPDFVKLVNYFEYKAPMIDCVHSVGSEASVDKQNEILKKMLSESDMVSNSKFLERIQKNSMELMGLDGPDMCMKCQRMLCKKRKDETELASVLRHLRNGFAHGHTYVKRLKNQTYIVIEDFDKKKKCSAKIVITKAILNRWYKLIKEENWD